MGLLDRLAKAVADQIVKAPNLPAGANTMNEAQMRGGGSVSNQYWYGTSEPLPRNPVLATVPFAPGMPLIPGALNPLNPETNRPAPRRYEYTVAQNINISENRPVPFKTLRAAADQIDILRRCIEVRKAKITGLEWDIVLSDAATERIISESGGDHLKAMANAREQFADEIARLHKFWETPDPSNGLSFVDWLNMAIEEIDVLDAWAIWPEMTVGGEIRGLQILDGSTIKPLLDDRGMRPDPSVGPAYQQILYGFPRSEFSATQDDEQADGEFNSDELAYFVRNRRANSVYGYPPVERALMMADIYLRRQQWLRAEFTDGVAPKMLLELPENAMLTPEQIRAYENIINDDLAGQTEQRHRARILYPGMKAILDEGYAEKFNDRLDDYLVTSITGHFGVLPTEIGFSAKTGLGGSGHQQGEADAAEQIGIIPTARWISQMISNLSYRWLGMPRELEFRLAPSDRVDNADIAKRDDILTRNGTKTVNENRAEKGLPLIDTPEADMPLLVAGQSVFLFSPDGLVAAGTPLDESGMVDESKTAPVANAQQPVAENEEKPVPSETPEAKESDKSKAAKDEIKTFIRWVRKGNHNRSFKFEAVEKTYAEVLNKFAEEGDLDGARWYAERYLGL
jgi:Phage portal protein